MQCKVGCLSGSLCCGFCLYKVVKVEDKAPGQIIKSPLLQSLLATALSKAFDEMTGLPGGLGGGRATLAGPPFNTAVVLLLAFPIPEYRLTSPFSGPYYSAGASILWRPLLARRLRV